MLVLALCLVAKSARSFCALKTIRAHDLNGNALWDVTRATFVSQLLYASPAWWGYLKADERNHLQSLIKKAKRYGCLSRFFSTLDELREDSDEKLFSSSRHNPNHVLHRLLRQPKNTGHNIRQRTHNLILYVQMSILLSNETLFIECYFETSINCIVFYVLLLFCLHFVIFHSTLLIYGRPM